jgi:hypothetical protein
MFYPYFKPNLNSLVVQLYRLIYLDSTFRNYNKIIIIRIIIIIIKIGARGRVVVKVLCYRSEGRGLETR